jgi:hypothetical protein
MMSEEPREHVLYLRRIDVCVPSAIVALRRGVTSGPKAAKLPARHNTRNHPVTANETYDAWEAK